jgi:hypothetical protein
MPIKDKAYHANWWRKKWARMTPEEKAAHRKRKNAYLHERKAQGKMAWWPKTEASRMRQSELYYRKTYGEFWEAKMLLNLFYREMRRSKDYEQIAQIKADKKRRPTSQRGLKDLERGLRRFKELSVGDDDRSQT